MQVETVQCSRLLVVLFWATMLMWPSAAVLAHQPAMTQLQPFGPPTNTQSDRSAFALRETHSTISAGLCPAH